MRLIDANDLVGEIDVTPYANSAACERENILEQIELAPTIDAAPVVRGEWLCIGTYPNTTICSKCRDIAPYEQNSFVEVESPFCPNCGADMRKNGEQ